jgi:hypothetical protein
LVRSPLFAHSADNALEPAADKPVREIDAVGGQKVTATHAAAGQSWSGRRFGLERTIVNPFKDLKLAF